MARPVRRSFRRLTLVLFAALLPALLLPGCAASLPPPESPAPRLVVFAASSLSEAFTELGRQFAVQNPGLDVQFNFAGSQALAQQINSGAPADVFASADERQMQAVVSGGRIAPESVRAFAGNRLVIVVPADNRAGIESLDDLARPQAALVLAAEEVPAGAYARRLIAAAAGDPAYGPDFEARVLANVVSLEENVRAALAKVALGEADAGIVYASDAAREPAVRGIEVPAAYASGITYTVSALNDTAADIAAGRFVDFVLSETGQSILEGYGFEPVAE